MAPTLLIFDLLASSYFMLVVQILAIIVFVSLLILAVLAFVEPGPLNRRSRDRLGQRPPPPHDEMEQPTSRDD